MFVYATRTHTSWWSVLLWILQKTCQKRSTKMHLIFPRFHGDQTIVHLLVPLLHIQALKGYLLEPPPHKKWFSYTCTKWLFRVFFRWQSNSSVLQNYVALVKLILHPRSMPKKKALAAICFRYDNVCGLHI